MAKSSKKGKTPQAKRFGAAARSARAKCKSEPGSTYFKCVGREMRAALGGKRKRRKRK